MKASLVVLLCLAVIAELALARVPPTSSLSHEWSLYKRQYGKSYASPEEEVRRFANFLAAKALVERHNADPDKSAHLQLNHLSDWDQEDLDKLTGLRIESSRPKAKMIPDVKSFLDSILCQFDSKPVPDAVDWRKEPNRVSQVKNQGQCGSCWAFATTGLLEGQQVVQDITKELVPLNEQDLVDCSKRDVGCDGGYTASALDDIKAMGGIDSEADYPYVAKDQECKLDKKKVVMTVKGETDLDEVDEAELKKYVAGYGPVAVAMLASDELKHYSSGVWTKDQQCSQPAFMPNHAVLIVGYGTDLKSGDFWIAKNSWGPNWGEDGYFRIKRGSRMCGIGETVTLAMI